jgi:hypothetical protein
MRIGNARRDEDGSVLILALVFIVLFGTVVALMLNYANSGFGLSAGEVTKSHQLYAADGAIQYATRQVQATNGQSCPANMTGGGLNLTSSAMLLPNDVSSVNVTCKQYTGPGSNLFGGYALVAGVNVSNAATPVYSANAGAGCQSLSSDPVGGGTATFASGTGNCLTYPAGAAPQQWFTVDTPDAVTTLSAVYEIDAHDMLFAGTNTSTHNPTLWFSDGDEFVDAANTAAAPNTTGIEITNAKTSLSGVWASDENHVWAIGADNGTPYVWFSSTVPNSETDPTTVTWTHSTPSTAKTLTGIYGVDANDVWVVGTTTASGNPGAVWFWNGTSWSAPVTPTNAKTLVSIDAVDATHVWALGTNTTAPNLGTVWFWNGTAWSAPTILSNAKTVTGIDALDANHVWAVGTNSVAPNSGTVWFFNGTSWDSGTTIAAAKTLTGVSATDATHVWTVGTSTAGGNPGSIWMWNGTAWTTTGQTLPSGTIPTLNDVSALTDPSNGSAVVTAVGNTSEVLRYAPTSANGCNPQCLAQIMGGPVFNANGLNLASGLQIGNGNFTQMSTPSCPSPVTTPSNLVIPTGFSYNCTTTVPSSILNLSEPLPTAKPAAAPAPTTVPVSGVTGCPSYNVYYPGTYTSKISFTKGTTNFFESGVYNFEGGWSPLDNGNTLPDTLYVIGGKPSPGDVVTIASGSPCWSTIQASSYYNAGTGTGVEFIMSGQSWWDVHTVNCELFTRQGGPANEGAQGISFRDVSGVLSTSSPWGSDLSNPGGVNQIFQVDANNHIPNMYVHGGIYAPNHNVVEYNNQQQVTLGPIFANSIEFAFASSTTPQLRVSGGSPGNATVVLTATTGQVTVQAFIPFDTNGNMVTDPTKGYTWRVLSPS